MYTPSNSMGKVELMLDLVSQRQMALGDNLANIHTPGYVRKDVNFSDYLSSLNSPLETKLSRKLGPSALIEEHHQEEIRPDKELLEIQNNALIYNMATRRMSNIITEMKTVINVGK
ncbi:hypothetical protein IKP85_05600 [bacterium]|nr:hypothetical protein [bacterium]